MQQQQNFESGFIYKTRKDTTDDILATTTPSCLDKDERFKKNNFGLFLHAL